MFLQTASLALALLPFATAAVHDVKVGDANGGLTFSPEAIAAAPGDQVVFHFYPKNHTVTQSSFAAPCGPFAGGVHSGFMPVAAGETPPTFTVPINDTKPLWIYCGQGSGTPNSHCGKGMVFAVNCGLDGAPNSFANFKKAALQIGAQIGANAPSSASAGSGSAQDAPTSTYTAAYGGVTIPPPEKGTQVAQTITLQESTWTTTYTSYPNSPDPTPDSLSGTVHKVIVGGVGKLTFDPARIVAKPRDIVMFEFHEKNHTVTQSAFSDPCRKFVSAATGATGFDSGFMPYDSSQSTFPVWNLTINDTAPIWGYCRQGDHCGAGMVFAINSDEQGARNLASFQSLAQTLNGTSNSSTTGTSSGGGSGGGYGYGSAGFSVAPSVAFSFIAATIAALL